MMDAQTSFNAAMGLIAFLGAWVLNRLSADIKALQVADADLVKAVQHIELLIAGSYVKRDDLDKMLDKLALAIFAKLDKIELKLDGKADK